MTEETQNTVEEVAQEQTEQATTEQEVTMTEEDMDKFAGEYIDAVMAEDVNVEAINGMSARVPSDMNQAKRLAEVIKTKLETYDDTERRNNAIEAMDILINGVNEYNQEQRTETSEEEATEES